MGPVRQVGFPPVKDLIHQLRQHERFRDISARLKDGKPCSVGGLWGSSAGLLLAALAEEHKRQFVVVVPGEEAALNLIDDLKLFGSKAELFSAWESVPSEDTLPNPEILTARMGLVQSLRSQPDGEPAARMIVAPVQAIMQLVPSAGLLDAGEISFRVGAAMEMAELKGRLVENQFEAVDEVELPGQFSARGGVLDVFPYTSGGPYRIEFVGDEIGSLRRFDPTSQRSTDRIESFRMVIVKPSDVVAPPAEQQALSLIDYVRHDACVVFVEPEQIHDRALRTFQVPGIRVESYHDLRRRASRLVTLSMSSIAFGGSEGTFDFQTSAVADLGGELSGRMSALARLAREGLAVAVFCNNAAEEKRFRAILDDAGFGGEGCIRTLLGRPSGGFRMEELGIAIVSDREIFGRYRQRRTVRAYEHARPIQSFADVRAGDYVVHEVHGIGRFRGLEMLSREGKKQEFLCIEYRDKTRVYVPISKIGLVQKYVGIGGARPHMDRIGGTAWKKRRASVRAAVGNLAKELLEVQAARERLPGIAYPGESEWQREFESAFIYEETEDQLKVADEIQRDMEKRKPMDRLVCGDVGYGKTELAMRAAFRAMSLGKQVAVLVPTTVLAQQHYQTFSERMADYPVFVEVLSRFRTPAEQRDILERTRAGKIDILIGTHRLIQKDVQFKDLGLVIVDEEQRFGVEDKEKLKRLRETVDVLTMTATPIPRTLHMSLLGIRDISTLTTPPQDRLAIETRVCRFDAGLIRQAVLQELSREGQVFFVHNRVENIHNVARKISQIVPEARIGVGHGQMHERGLEQCMLDFMRRDVDVLVCTTIIESGLDIPNANTIFINSADRFGLADLHQLRGRVGRYKHKAFAYLLVPTDRPITPEAQKRLKAIADFSELGAGFRIALRDLEIRGAGNMLGREQSGHIGAVGYEMYASLLEAAVRAAKGEKPTVSAEPEIELGLEEYIPDGFVPSVAQKMEIYRRVSRTRELEEVEDLSEELKDRFGPIPRPVQNMLDLAALRILCRECDVTGVGRSGRFLVLRALRPRELCLYIGNADPRMVDKSTVYVPLPKRANPEWIMGYLRRLLAKNRAPAGRRE